MLNLCFSPSSKAKTEANLEVPVAMANLSEAMKKNDAQPPPRSPQASAAEDGKENSTKEDVAAEAPITTVAVSAVSPAPVPTIPILEEDMGLNYDESCTVLYKAIENKDWNKAIAQCVCAPEEASQFLYRKDAKKLRWKLMPIHASLIFKAPSNVVESLLKANPQGLWAKDDRGMTPLHLAFRHNAPDDVIYELMKVHEDERTKSDAEGKDCPCILDATDRKGRKPLDLHRVNVVGPTKPPGSPIKGDVFEQTKSGIGKYVTIAVQNEHDKVVKELTSEYNQKQSLMDEQYELKLAQTKKANEDIIATVQAEMEAALKNMEQSKIEWLKEYESKRKELEKELRTAQLATESLIHRLEQKSKNTEQMEDQLLDVEERLSKLESGEVGLLDEKEKMIRELVSQRKQFQEEKSALEATREELEQTIAKRDALMIETLDAEKAFTEADIENKRLVDSNGNMEEFLSISQNQVPELQAKVDFLEENVKAKSEKINMLQKQNEMTESLIQDYNENFNAYENQLDIILQKLDDLDRAETINVELTMRLAKVNEQLKLTTESLDRIDVDEWGNQLVALTEEVVQLEVENEELKNEHETTKETFEKCKSEMESAKTASNALLEKFKAKCATEAQLKTKLVAAEAKYNELNDPEVAAANMELKEIVELLESQQEELAEKQKQLEEEIYHKTAEYKDLQRQSEMSPDSQLYAMELKLARDNERNLEKKANELQDKLAELTNEHDTLSEEFRAMGYADAREMYKALTLKQEEEETLTLELSNKLRDLSDDNEDLIRKMEEAEQKQELSLVKMHHKETHTQSALALRQRMVDALEEQLEASQELTEELQARLRTLEARHSGLLTKASGVSEQYHQLKFDEARQMESNLALRQRLTYEMQLERQKLLQQSQEYDRRHRLDSIEDDLQERESAEPLAFTSISSPVRTYAFQSPTRNYSNSTPTRNYGSSTPTRKDSIELATIERVKLMEATRRQKHDLESSYADASAAISMLRNIGL